MSDIPIDLEEARRRRTTKIEGDSSSDDRNKAITSARRAAVNGDDKGKAIARIKKNYGGVGSEAAKIVEEAWAWRRQYEAGSAVDIGGIQKRVTSLDELNTRFAILVDSSTTAVVDRREASLISHSDLSTQLANEVLLAGVKENGSAKFIDAAKAWIGDCRRHQYRRIVFTSKPTAPAEMNLFTGFGVAPREGEWGLIRTFIREVLCSGSDADFEAMLSLIAWQLQNIGEPSRIIVTFVSEQQQTGKNTLLEHVLLPIYGRGRAGWMTTNIDDVVGSFNEILRGKAFVFLDEAMFNGDRSAGDKLKGLSASKSVALNKKHVNQYLAPAGLNFWIASNRLVPAHVEEKDARYWSLKISEHRHGDYDYWTALYNEIENGGREAFLHAMLARDVGNFIPQRDIPRDNALHREQVKAGLNPADPRMWIEESLDADRLLYVPALGIGDDVSVNDRLTMMREWLEGNTVAPGEMYIAYKTWVSKLRGYGARAIGTAEFWKCMAAFGFEEGKTNGKRWRRLPSPDECRARLAAQFGGKPLAEVEEIDFP